MGGNTTPYNAFVVVAADDDDYGMHVHATFLAPQYEQTRGQCSARLCFTVRSKPKRCQDMMRLHTCFDGSRRRLFLVFLAIVS